MPQLFLQLCYTIYKKDLTYITIFSSIFSVISIISSAFEYVSSKLLLKTETVLIIRLDIKSKIIGALSVKQFQTIENLRKLLRNEIAKITDISYDLIELLLPKQTKDGLSLIFHARLSINEQWRSQ